MNAFFNIDTLFLTCFLYTIYLVIPLVCVLNLLNLAFKFSGGIFRDQVSYRSGQLWIKGSPVSQVAAVAHHTQVKISINNCIYLMENVKEGMKNILKMILNL